MPEVRRFPTVEAPPGVLDEIRHMLVHAFEGNFSDEDWEHTVGGWHVVIAEGGAPISHAAVVRRVLHVGGRAFSTGYVEGVATAPARQREGHGTRAMEQVNELVRGEFDMGALSTGVHGLYARLGWERWRGPTYVWQGAEVVRTEEEDDGVMVLRFGPSAGIDLSEAISCEARPGDDW